MAKPKLKNGGDNAKAFEWWDKLRHPTKINMRIKYFGINHNISLTKSDIQYIWQSEEKLKMEKVSPYQFAITNCARYIRDNNHLINSTTPPLNAFQLAEVLSIAFVKNTEEVCLDIVNANLK